MLVKLIKIKILPFLIDVLAKVQGLRRKRMTASFVEHLEKLLKYNMRLLPVFRIPSQVKRNGSLSKCVLQGYLKGTL